jgi:sulfite exporter TauE/SafE
VELITALTIGLIGSLHCAGMCGPIAIALPLARENWLRKISGGLLYNFGRILTYGVLGGLFGLLGRGIKLAGLQQWASIAIGIIMIVSVLFPFIFREKILIDDLFSGYARRLTGGFRKLFSRESLPSLFIIGLLNGLLPCGLVYVALAGAINTNDVVMGVAFMMMFGIGTTPMLLGISIMGNMISLRLKRKLSKVIPIFIVMLGLLFILRGMSLGIPYVSPKAEKLEVKQEMKVGEPCCH